MGAPPAQLTASLAENDCQKNVRVAHAELMEEVRQKIGKSCAYTAYRNSVRKRVNAAPAQRTEDDCPKIGKSCDRTAYGNLLPKKNW